MNNSTVETAPRPAAPAGPLGSRFTPEQVRIVRGPLSGETIIVSVDSTRLGPALGGCRIKPYPTWRDGLADVLNLSAAMTDKAALAGLNHGGGKTVVALDRGSSSSEWTGSRRDDLLADIADLVDSFNGAYITGPDIGTSPADMGRIRDRTRYALCRPKDQGGSGDSSIPTALGVTSSIAAVCEHVWPGRDLATLRFAVIGLGHVGSLVGSWLADHDVQLTVADIDPRPQALANQWGATWLDPSEALLADVDVVVPCAIGGILTPTTVSELRCGAVVGAANNQLDQASTADLLRSRGICWAPDTLVSGGGIISSVARELNGATETDADQQVRAIGDRLSKVLTDADTRGVTTHQAARDLVARRLHPGH